MKGRHFLQRRTLLRWAAVTGKLGFYRFTGTFTVMGAGALIAPIGVWSTRPARDELAVAYRLIIPRSIWLPLPLLIGGAGVKASPCGCQQT